MTAFTDDDVAAASEALYQMVEDNDGWPTNALLVTVILAAVAPQIAARALRDAADEAPTRDLTWAGIRKWLRARADRQDGAE